jgi:O-antigen/teichoic acid export membrane protein
VSRATLKILMLYGASTVVLEVANIMRFQLDRIVIAKWVRAEDIVDAEKLTSFEMVTVYSIAAILIKHYLNFVVRGTQSVFTPRFSSIDGTGDRDELRRMFLKSLRIAAFLTCCGGTLLLLLGEPFIHCWAADDVAGWRGALAPLAILGLAYIVALSQNPGIALVFALKKHHFLAAASMVEGIANLCLSIYLAPRYGIVGVAWGTAIPMLVIKVVVQPIYVTRLIGVSLLSYWVRILPPMVLVGLLVAFGGVPGITFSENFAIALLAMSATAIPYVAAFAALYMIVTKLSRRKVSEKKAEA